jgi:Rhodopirellula transposase DDE domain
MNWRGRPLTSHEVVVATIAATRTRTGLRVEAALDSRDYPLGMSVSAERMSALPVTPHAGRAEQRFFEQRGGPRRQARGRHGRPQPAETRPATRAIHGRRTGETLVTCQEITDRTPHFRGR